MKITEETSIEDISGKPLGDCRIVRAFSLIGTWEHAQLGWEVSSKIEGRRKIFNSVFTLSEELLREVWKTLPPKRKIPCKSKEEVLLIDGKGELCFPISNLGGQLDYLFMMKDRPDCPEEIGKALPIMTKSLLQKLESELDSEGTSPLHWSPPTLSLKSLPENYEPEWLTLENEQ